MWPDGNPLFKPAPQRGVPQTQEGSLLGQGEGLTSADQEGPGLRGRDAPAITKQ